MYYADSRLARSGCPEVSVLSPGKEDTNGYSFMKEWFPKEVKEKQRENEVEIANEQGMVVAPDPKCVIM